MVFELLGYTDANQMIVIGQKQLSMIDMIQRQMLKERELQSEKQKNNPNKNRMQMKQLE